MQHGLRHHGGIAAAPAPGWTSIHAEGDQEGQETEGAMTTGELVRKLQALDPKGKLPVMITTEDGKALTGQFALHVYGVPTHQDSHRTTDVDTSIQDGRHRNYVLAMRPE